MMKNLIIATCAVLGITALNACSQQEIPDTPAPTAGTITVTARTAEEQTGTKTTLSGLETHWVKDVDKIGVFSPQAAGQKNNVLYTAQSNGKTSAFTGSLVWGTGAHNFYAYYPYNSTYTGDHTAVPFSLPSEQTQSAANNTDHIGALDYMTARHEGVTPSGPVSFTFKHFFAMIEFKITGSGTLKKIRLTGANPLAYGDGIIKFLSGGGQDILTFSFSNYVTVTLTTPAPLSDSPISVFMMVVEGNHSENLRIALNFNDGTWIEMSKAPPTDGRFWDGEKYVVTLDTEDASAGWAQEFKDFRDGQIYPYVTIGTQTWMAKNLAYLPEVYPFDDYGGYYVYGYNGTDVATAKTTANYQTYGVLYNWDVAMAGAASSDSNPSGVQGICPDGWHLPSDAEWKQLEMQLGMSAEDADKKDTPRGTDEGDQLKEVGTVHWETGNNGTNTSGFTALPGGCRNMMSTYFEELKYGGYWWTSTEAPFNVIYVREMQYNKSTVYRSALNENNGLSVRCVRD
ncbi:MAG TPA: FISUMP domain-containing protein [Bacteroidales bacterium]|nr:FISUMP domain-containing protein [Bacteroidales bacterium]